MTNLSPTAQAVLDAAESAHDECDLRPALAAALRAGVCQLSADDKLLSMNSDACIGMGHVFHCLLSLAEELEEDDPCGEILDYYDALAAQHTQAVYHHD